jgi:hypothetical protein
MKEHFMYFLRRSNFWVWLITCVLFVIPFFWIAPDQMDLGGDENRLFFYDPLQFIYTNGLFFKDIITLGNRSFYPSFDYIPFVSILFLIKSVFNSSYVLISLLNGIKVSISFLSIYLIIKTILKNSYQEKNELLVQIPSILAGLLYTTAPIVIGNYEKALLSHDQIFLNPLCFYLLLKYFIEQKFRYLLGFIALSLIFTTSFAWVAAPPLFAFFPLALVSLLVYVGFILKKKIHYLQLVSALILFLGLHAFHLIPELFSLFSSNNYINERVFNTNGIMANLNYFYGVLPLSKLSFNILLYAPFKQYMWLTIIPVFFLLLGLCFSGNKNRTLPLIGTFFLLTLYLVTANITHMGVKLYELFFYIPGFSMFRNFIGQWAFVYSFFYALFFGIAMYFLFRKINNIKVAIIIALVAVLSLIASSWNFFTGGMVNTVLFQTNGVKIPMVMNPNYERTLAFVRTLKGNGSFVSFPFTDSYETVIHGADNGAYEGPSPINWLVGRLDYNGYIAINPFGEIFFKLVKGKDYNGIKKLLGILHVEYIYYNDDQKIYDKTFPGNPYNSARAVFPKTQAGYKDLIKKIAGKEIYHKGTFHIFETDKSYFHPEFYAASNLKTYKPFRTELYTQTNPFFDSSSQTRDVFMDNATCLKIFSKAFCSERNKQLGDSPQIQFKKINPTVYRIHVKNMKQKGYLLVFSKTFSSTWDVSLSTNSTMQDLISPKKIVERQILVNGYANAWYILPKYVNNRPEYDLTIQLSDQRIFYIGLAITSITLVLFLIYSGVLLLRKRKL